MSEHKGLPILSFPDLAAWEAWLAQNAAGHAGFWMKFAKKSCVVGTVSKREAIEAALCHGWIDGQLDSFDSDFWLTRFTPRGPRSKWSEINREVVAHLIEAGRMRPAGQAEIDKAKADGRWEAAYAPASRMTVPPDFQAALDAMPEAARFFATLTGSSRYAFLYRIHDAKRPATRVQRIEKFTLMLARGETIRLI